MTDENPNKSKIDGRIYPATNPDVLKEIEELKKRITALERGDSVRLVVCDECGTPLLFDNERYVEVCPKCGLEVKPAL